MKQSHFYVASKGVCAITWPPKRSLFKKILCLLACFTFLPTPAWSDTLGKSSFGTAFMVSDNGHLLTAWHVIKDKEQVFIGPFGDKKWVKADVLLIDADNDLALLSTPTIRSRALTIAEWSSVPLGLEVYVIGYPRPGMMGLTKKLTQGIINGDRLKPGSKGLFQFSAEIQQGNSGGPVLAPDGTVVGLAQRKLDALKIAERSKDLPQNVNYGTKSIALLEFMREAGIRPKTTATDLSLNPRPYLIYKQTEQSVFAVLAGQKRTAVTPFTTEGDGSLFPQ